MVLANVAPRINKRFPTLKHFVTTGLLLDTELSVFYDIHKKCSKPSKHWLPIVWATSIVTYARREDRICNDFAVKTLIDELNHFCGNCSKILHCATINIPLIYTQVRSNFKQ